MLWMPTELRPEDRAEECTTELHFVLTPKTSVVLAENPTHNKFSRIFTRTGPRRQIPLK